MNYCVIIRMNANVLMQQTTINYGALRSKERRAFRKLKELPVCTELYCSDGKLEQLPKLPNCVELDCYNNQLSNLPDLPECIELNCSRNQLRNLPELPKCKKLLCFRNQLRNLPDLPNCNTLWSYNNPLQELPDLPKCSGVWLENSDGYEGVPLYYGIKFASRFRVLDFPSAGHHIHYVRKWQDTYIKIKKVQLLQQITELDQYLAFDIVKKSCEKHKS